MTEHQPELLREGVTEEDVQRFRALLRQRGWQKRKHIFREFGWSDRKIRDVAQSMGADVVRGQLGFNLTSQVKREEIGHAVAAADAFISQGKQMMRYGIALKRRLHQRLC